MSHAQGAVDDAGFNLIRQLAQSEKIGHRRAAFANPGGCLVLGQIQPVNQVLVCLGFFNRIQIFALDVFDQRHFQQFFIADPLDDHRHLGQSRPFGGAQAPFTGDELIAGLVPSHQQRLQDALVFDGFGKLLQVIICKNRPRLKPVGSDQVDVAIKKVLLFFVFRIFDARDQGPQAPAQGRLFALDVAGAAVFGQITFLH